MLKRLLVVVVSLFSLISFADAQVEIIDSGEKKVTKKKAFGKEGPFVQTQRTISIKNQGPVNYGFLYRYYACSAFKEKHPNRAFPYIGDVTARTSGLGLTGGPWYTGGFLGIEINKKTLYKTLAKEIKVVEQGERGVVDVLWEPEWGKIKARFVILPGDDKVYTEITLAPDEEVKSLKLILYCRPGHWRAPHDRWLSTAKRSVQLSKESTSLNPKEEPWIFYFDTKAKNIYGTCAVMYLPEEVTSAKVRRGVQTHLTFSPELRKIHLILWSFPDNYKKPEEAYQYLKENGEELLEKLRKFKF